ncbi:MULTISPECIES: hypothetical protein [unclassified Flavobacterium]|jgi:hypothetical protein|uniref:hypothetical protein n=1 Tax=unclassified Flavobacterium TaxID=196869 RepID=UPI003F8DFA5C
MSLKTIEVKNTDGLTLTIFVNHIVAVINRNDFSEYNHRTAIITTVEKVLIKTNVEYGEIIKLINS